MDLQAGSLGRIMYNKLGLVDKVMALIVCIVLVRDMTKDMF